MTRRGAWWLGITGAIAAIAVGWLMIPWEWSMIDDPGLVISVRAAIDEHGFLGGMVAHVGHMAAGDRVWGLFRPSYWVYPSLVYWLPIGPAHLVRLSLLALALGGPLLALRRRGASPIVVAAAACVLLSGASTLMLGLTHLSLQELSGAAFVGLGLMVHRPWLRLGSWTIAAWFKSPFAWLLVGEAVVAWRAGRLRQAMAAATIGVGTLLAAFAMARNGTYTSSYGDSSMLGATVAGNLRALIDVTLLLPVLVAAWWFLVTRTRPRLDGQVLALAIGTVGYTLQMLPWKVTNHYQGGIAYVMTVAIAFALSEPSAISTRRRMTALAIPVLVAVLVVISAVTLVLTTNARFHQITECLLSRPDAPVLVATEFGPEAAVRIEQNAELADSRWRGRVEFAVDPSDLTRAAEGTLLVVPVARSGELAGAHTVCSMPAAAVLEVGR